MPLMVDVGTASANRENPRGAAAYYGRGRLASALAWRIVFSEERATEEKAAAERDTRLVELDRDECLRLLAATNLGRLAVNVRDWVPVIRPVNYVFDRSSQSVVFRSARGSKLTALMLSGQAAFEIDGIEPDGQTGWSVIVTGSAEEVTNTADLQRLEHLSLTPWAPGDKPHWLRIRTAVVSGRRIAS